MSRRGGLKSCPAFSAKAMSRLIKHIVAGIFVLTLSISACKKETIKENSTPFVPVNFPTPVYDLSVNPVTEPGFILGRKLFYDPILSRDNSTSCGSCHQQFASFVHAGHIVSHGIDDKLGTRNSPPVINMLWSKTFFWDGGVHNLDLVPPNPIHNPVEMDEKFENVLVKLRNTEGYPKLFESAFGTDEITSVRFLQALSQFMASLVSANSRYDKYVRNEGGTLAANEQEGLQLFQQKCASCHATDLFTDRGFHNNGIQTSIADSGRYAITLNPGDIGKFKTPTLRNIEKTSPYMHNGNFRSLEEVLNHYANGIRASATLDSTLNNNAVVGIPLTADEQQKIIAFLKTLTDEEFLRDKRFAEQ